MSQRTKLVMAICMTTLLVAFTFFLKWVLGELCSIPNANEKMGPAIAVIFITSLFPMAASVPTYAMWKMALTRKKE